MAKAIWNGAVIAESDAIEVVEGNVYFPPHAIRDEFFAKSPTTTECWWKGTAHYFDVVVDGQKNTDAAWTYPETKPKAENIRGYVAFWRGVDVQR